MNLSIATTTLQPLKAGGGRDERRPIRMRGPVVTPFARALSLLDAFSANARWLGNRELSMRCDIPVSTVWRLAQSLVTLGYLLYDEQVRKYRLAPSVLALGYAGAGQGGVQHPVRDQMQAYADLQSVRVSLSTRDRLDIVVLDSVSPACPSPDLPGSPARADLLSSPMGWALLSAVPEHERCYLLQKAERRAPQESAALRRRIGRAVAQVREAGYCSSVSERFPELGIVAAPVLGEGRAPRVIGCIGPASRFTLARVQRELGPCLLALAAAIGRSDGIAA